MIGLAQRLFDRLKPSGVVGLKIGRWDDRSTWVVSPSSPSAQAILDAFDPVAEKAAVESDQQAESTRAEKLQALAEWLRTQSRDVREKFQDLQAELDATKARAAAEIGMNRTHIKALETAFQSVKKAWQPPAW